MARDSDQGAAMPVGDILAVAAVLLLFMTFAFGVVYLQYCFVACHRRRRRAAALALAAAAASSPQSAPRRGGRDGDPESLLSPPAAAVYRAAARSKEEEEAVAEYCAVCLAGLEVGEEARFMPCCGHGFHAQCVGTWLAMASRPTCPLCRRINVAARPPAPASALPRVPPEHASYHAANLPLPARAYEQGVVAVITDRSRHESR